MCMYLFILRYIIQRFLYVYSFYFDLYSADYIFLLVGYLFIRPDEVRRFLWNCTVYIYILGLSFSGVHFSLQLIQIQFNTDFYYLCPQFPLLSVENDFHCYVHCFHWLYNIVQILLFAYDICRTNIHKIYDWFISIFKRRLAIPHAKKRKIQKSKSKTRTGCTIKYVRSLYNF